MKLFTHSVNSVSLRWSLIPLAVGAAWIIGFYTPEYAETVLASRWEISIVFAAVASLVVLRYGGIRGNAATSLLIAILLLLVVSTAWSFTPLYTFLRSVSAIILVVSTFLLAQSMIHRPEDIRRFAYLMMLLYAGLVAVFFYSTLTNEYAFLSGRLHGNHYFKATGGGNILVSAGILLIWYLRYCARWQLPAIVGLLVVIGICILLTRSRVPIVGAVVTWPAAWVLSRGGRLKATIIAPVLIAIAGYYYVFSSEESASYLRIDTEELQEKGLDITSGRIERWQFLFNLGMNKPFLGHGFGTSRYARWRWTNVNVPYLEWTRDINDTKVQQVAHNQHVQMFFEVGFVGLGLFWLLLFIILKRGVLVTRFSNTPETLFLKVMFISICFHLLDSLSHDGYFSSGAPPSYVFWIKVGILMQGSRVILNERRRARTQGEEAPDSTSSDSLPAPA